MASKAAPIIVREFKNELYSAGIHDFNDLPVGGSLVSILTAEDYVLPLFGQNMPSFMACKSVLTTSLSIIDTNELQTKITKELLRNTLYLPTYTVHEGEITFKWQDFVLITGRESGEGVVTALLTASKRLLRDS